MITSPVSRAAARPRSIAGLAMLAALTTLVGLAACADTPTQPAPSTSALRGPGRPAASLSAAILQLSDTAFHFGDVPMSGRSTSRKVTVRNVGTIPMTVLSWYSRDAGDNVALEFQASDDRNNYDLPPWRECLFGDSIAPGDSCEIRIDFTPRYRFGAGKHTARLYVNTDGGSRFVDMDGTSIYASDLSIRFGALLSNFWARQGESVTLVSAIGMKQWSAPAKDIVVTMPTPTYTTFFSYSAPKGYSCTAPKVGAAGALTCKLAAFAYADSTYAYPDTVGPDIKMVVKVANNAPVSEFAKSTATVSASTYDPALAGNSSPMNFQVWPKK